MAKLNLRSTTGNKHPNTDAVEKFVHDQVREAWMPPIPVRKDVAYIFRTVNMCNVGRVIGVTGNFIELDDDTVWVSDAGKWGQLLGNSNYEQAKFEAFNRPVYMNVNLIVDFTEWLWEIPKPPIP